MLDKARFMRALLLRFYGKFLTRLTASEIIGF